MSVPDRRLIVFESSGTQIVSGANKSSTELDASMIIDYIDANKTDWTKLIALVTPTVATETAGDAMMKDFATSILIRETA